MNTSDYRRFENLSFDDFRRMAGDDSLSIHEKVGFPDTYRRGKEEVIFQNIVTRLPKLESREQVVLEIGPGCSNLPRQLIELCRRQNHTLILVDSAEMLSQLPDDDFIRKVPGYYPNCPTLFQNYHGAVDVILAYSVLHYIFVESNLWDFLDRSLELMSGPAEMLIGDIPNISKRKRFFSSARGVSFHQAFTASTEPPTVKFNEVERHCIDDSVIMSVMMRARQQGFDAYVIPQHDDLPMANRREDILIRKP